MTEKKKNNGLCVCVFVCGECKHCMSNTCALYMNEYVIPENKKE